MSILLDKTLRLFLDSIGRREEYEFYLERFQLGNQAAFALLVPLYEGFAESAAVFAFDLHFLLRLGLHPVVFLCGAHASAMAALLDAEEHAFVFVCWRADVPLDALEGQLQEASAAGHIAVIVGEYVDVREGLSLLVPRLTRRVHMIRAAGPLHREDGKPLWYYQAQDPVRLVPADESIAKIAVDALHLAEGVHISIASPLNLLAELFTVKGAGCLVRRGVRITCQESIGAVDRGRLVQLFEDSFGRSLLCPACLDAAARIYLDADYRCAALLEPQHGYMYLSKFAVHRAARGEGLAQELWRTVERAHPAIFWRSRLGNPFNQWYDRQASGVHTEGSWRIYWRGVARQDLPAVIEAALARPLDFAVDPLSAS